MVMGRPPSPRGQLSPGRERSKNDIADPRGIPRSRRRAYRRPRRQVFGGPEMNAGSQSPPDPDPQLVAHERTYRVFNVLLRWCMVVLASTITGLTLWSATPAGLMRCVFTALFLLA